MARGLAWLMALLLIATVVAPMPAAAAPAKAESCACDMRADGCDPVAAAMPCHQCCLATLPSLALPAPDIGPPPAVLSPAVPRLAAFPADLDPPPPRSARA